jgi:hypothetical protein
MDDGDKLAADPKDLILDPALSANNPDNPDHAAGMTFLGPFLDHDMTLDASSSSEQQTDPEMIENFRRPIFELDSVYGTGRAPRRTSMTRASIPDSPACWWRPARGPRPSHVVVGDVVAAVGDAPAIPAREAVGPIT